MELLFAPLFSGSSGNAVYVGSADEAVIVDAGRSASAIMEEMKQNGLSADSVKALLVTHEHTDHISGVGPLARKLGVPVYATRGTWEGMRRRAGKLDEKNVRIVDTDMDFYIGGINVCPFATAHDSRESCGYLFGVGGLRAAVATDLGHVSDSWLRLLFGADVVLLESNYDPDMLAAGPYPYELQQRIRGRHGHLSNEEAANAAVRLAASGVGTIILGHLSKENNFPELALKTCEGILAENGYLAGKDVRLCVSGRDHCAGVFRVSAG